MCLVLTAAACRDQRSPGHAFPIPGERGERITVEVLNASGRTGLARVGMRVLRRAGIDVVYFGNSPTGPALDSTEIVVRRGSAARAADVRRALGVGRVVVQLDSTLLLDASVLLGADFRPRVDFHP